MFTPTDNWVPKVHPLARVVEPEDPMELIATDAPGDPDLMLDSVLHEFAWMGMDGAQLAELFHSPAYPVLNLLLTYFGEDEVRRRIEQLLARSGVLRVREILAEDPEPEGEPDLLQVSVQRVAERRPT
jgi:hypothetical protein